MKQNILALTGLFLLSNVVEDVAAIDWVTCPPEQINAAGSTWDCAYLEFDMDRADPSKGKVTSFVRRGYVGSPGAKSVWGINGGPGQSTKGFVPIFDYFMTRDPSLTSYLVDARGIGLSSRLWDCSDPPAFLNPYDSDIMARQDACNQEIIAKNGTVFPYFTTYDAAMDLLGVMQAVNPDTISLFAVSYGTFFANTFLQLPGAKVDVVVYDGPVSANRWPLENSAHMQSMVAFDALQMCIDESEVCKKYMGEMGHIPKMTNDALKDGVLPCISKVPWLAEDDGNFWTAFYNNWMGPNDKKALLAPFWQRMYRCSDSDAEQLIFFNNARQAEMATWGPSDPLDFGWAYGMNQGMDIYSQSGAMEKTYDETVALDEREFASDGANAFAFAEYVSNWPYSPHNNITSTFARPTVPMHIFVGTIDANTPVGQSQWIRDQYSATAGVSLYIVPYAQHGLVAPDNLCVTDVVTDILGFKTDVDTSCIETCKPPPDWDGSEEETRDMSLQWFGTRDLWNNGFEVDEVDAEEDDDDEVTFSQKQVTNLIIGICVPFSVIIIGLFAAVIFLCTRKQDQGLLEKNKGEDAL